MDDVLTVQEGARYLKVHEKTLQRWCREGKVPALRAGTRYRIRRCDLDGLKDGLRSEPETVPSPPEPVRRGTPGRVIAVANQKGGVGKTTTAQALGAALAELGDRVLLVDLDPQGSLTASFGHKPRELQRTIHTLMWEYMTEEQVPDAAGAIIPVSPNLYLLPSNVHLTVTENALPNQTRREYVLSEILAPLRASYDWLLIDCPPSLLLLTINALTCADSCLVPVMPEPLVTGGVDLLFDSIARVRRTKLNPKLAVEGVVITKVDPRPSLTRGVIEDLRVTLDGRIPVLGEVRNSIRVQEASASGVPLTQYRPAADAALSYRQIAEVLRAKHVHA